MNKIKKEDIFNADYIAFVEKMNECNRKKEERGNYMFIIGIAIGHIVSFIVRTILSLT